MSIRYTTVEKEAHEEQTIEKSRFIAHVYPVESKEEADAIIKQVRAQYRDASHNVPAFVIGEKMQLQWGSDDGEPQGTSGAPIVQMLVNEGLTNVLVVVTRYFGGIKLGPGGLVRAYTGTAKIALKSAGQHDVKDVNICAFDLAYNHLSGLQNLEGNLPFKIVSLEYTDKVSAQIEFEPEYKESIISALNDLTGGKSDLSNITEKIK